MTRGRRPLRMPTLLAALLSAVVAAPAGAASSVEITGLGDLRLGQWLGRGSLAADDWHCVRVVGGPKPRTFRLEAYGDGPGGAFELRNGDARLHYTVEYDDGRGQRRFSGPGHALSNLAASETGGELRRCRHGDRLEQKRVRVEVPEDELATAPAGRFQGTLLLMVVPE